MITYRQMFLRVLLVAVLAVGVVSVSAQQPAQATEILEEFTLQPDLLTVTVNATGTISPLRTAALNFQFVAPVSEILIAEGERVRAGDVIARLDADDLSASLREAEIALELQQLAYEALVQPPRDVDIAAAEAALAAAEAGIPAARTGPSREQLDIAAVQAELSRNQLWQAQLNRDMLFDRNPEFRGGLPNEIASQSSVQQAELGVALSETNIDVVRSRGGSLSALASAEAQLVRAQVALDQLLRGPDAVDLLKFEIQLDLAALAVEQARTALERVELVAPFDGIVSQNNLTVGQLPPQAVNGAIQLVDNSAYVVDLSIDETDIVNIALGQAVELRLDALPESQVTGVITEIDLLPNPQSTAVVYRARVALNPTNAPIRVGMTTTATIVTTELNDVLVLPNRFIRIDASSQRAYVTIQVGENRFEEVEVVLGERNSSESQVLSGLDVGQRIVRIPRGSLGLQDALGAAPS